MKKQSKKAKKETTPKPQKCPSFVRRRNKSRYYIRDGKISPNTIATLQEGDIIRIQPEETEACNYELVVLDRDGDKVEYQDKTGATYKTSLSSLQKKLQQAWARELKRFVELGIERRKATLERAKEVGRASYIKRAETALKNFKEKYADAVKSANQTTQSPPKAKSSTSSSPQAKEKPDEKYEDLPRKMLRGFEESLIFGHDENELARFLSLKNEAFRAKFEELTQTELPSTAKEIKEAVAEWLDSHKPPITYEQARNLPWTEGERVFITTTLGKTIEESTSVYMDGWTKNTRLAGSPMSHSGITGLAIYQDGVGKFHLLDQGTGISLIDGLDSLEDAKNAGDFLLSRVRIPMPLLLRGQRVREGRDQALLARFYEVVGDVKALFSQVEQIKESVKEEIRQESEFADEGDDEEGFDGDGEEGFDGDDEEGFDGDDEEGDILKRWESHFDVFWPMVHFSIKKKGGSFERAKKIAEWWKNNAAFAASGNDGAPDADLKRLIQKYGKKNTVTFFKALFSLASALSGNQSSILDANDPQRAKRLDLLDKLLAVKGVEEFYFLMAFNTSYPLHKDLQQAPNPFKRFNVSESVVWHIVMALSPPSVIDYRNPQTDLSILKPIQIPMEAKNAKTHVPTWVLLAHFDRMEEDLNLKTSWIDRKDSIWRTEFAEDDQNFRLLVKNFHEYKKAKELRTKKKIPPQIKESAGGTAYALPSFVARA